MSIKDGIRNFFGLNEEDTSQGAYLEEHPEQQWNRPAQKSNAKVIPISQRQPTQKASIHVLEPRVYSEAEEIAAFLLREEAVLLNFRRMEADQATKVIDFLQGTVFALKGDIQKVGEKIFLCTPANIRITNLNTEDQRDEYYY